MGVSLLLQYVVIALAVLVSVFVVVRRHFPVTWSRVCRVLGLYLTRPRRPVWVQRLGHRLVPKMRRAGACDRCGDCNLGSRRC
ncbi:MAG TPA: DUF6587 family protein [Xylella sp.]